ncbi:hypothetical protein LEMLEM_LOCUS16663, partial [Lemmus lemmus]
MKSVHHHTLEVISYVKDRTEPVSHWHLRRGPFPCVAFLPSAGRLEESTCLLISLKKQLPKDSRMTANRMLLHLLLSLSVSAPILSSPLSHIAPCLQEVARLE